MTGSIVKYMDSLIDWTSSACWNTDRLSIRSQWKNGMVSVISWDIHARPWNVLILVRWVAAGARSSATTTTTTNGWYVVVVVVVAEAAAAGAKMSADGVAAVVSGVDLALVSWMDGPVVDLSSISVASGQRVNREQLFNISQQQRIGRCLCAKDAAANSNCSDPTTTMSTKSVVVVTPGHESTGAPCATLPLLKPTLKKPKSVGQQQQPDSTTTYSGVTPTKTLSIDRRVHHQQQQPTVVPHLVPQVVEVVGPIQQHRSKQQQQQSGQVSRTNSCSTEVLPTSGATAGRPAPPPVGGCNNSVKLNRCNNNSTATLSNNVSSLSSRSTGGITNHHQQQPIESSLVASIVTSNKPILSRKNWNNTIDVSGVGGGSSSSAHHLQHQPSCLRRYGSQQSCKSATTLRSYVSSTGRGISAMISFPRKSFWLFPVQSLVLPFQGPASVRDLFDTSKKRTEKIGDSTSLSAVSRIVIDRSPASFLFTAHHHLYMCASRILDRPLCSLKSRPLYIMKKKRRSNL